MRITENMKFTHGCLVVLLIFELSNCDAWQIREDSLPDNEAVTTETSEIDETSEEAETKCVTELPAMNLSLTRLRLAHLPDDSIDNSYVVSLDLSDNNIISISQNAFRRLPKLRSLDLSGNMIDIIEVFFRVNISQLVTLKYRFRNRDGYIIDYNYDYVDLPQFPRLKTLDLKGSGQRVRKLKLETVTPQLTYLDLSDSDLDTDAIVGHLPLTITHLFLDNNKIDFTKIDMLENIEELSINRITTPKECADGYRDYREYDYGETCNDDPSRVIINAERWRKMKRLHLSGNNIKEVVDVAMSGQFNLLEFLDLSQNEISNINSNFIDLVPNLKYLSLSTNKLDSIPSALCSMDFLETLDLSDNQIETFFVNTSCTFKNLKKLNLRGNSISLIDHFKLDTFPSLTDLDLSSNRLTSLPRYSMNARMLEILRLNDNMFNALNKIDLHGFPDLKELHVEHNPLPLIRTDEMMDIWQNLTIYLRDMPAPEPQRSFKLHNNLL